jgi:ribosomal protein S18 acetylase RimI-like enzyme
VRRLGPEDGELVDAAVAVLATGLGPGYVTAAAVRALAASDRPEAAVFAALIGDEVVGAATADRASPALVSRVEALAGATGLHRPDLTTRSVGHSQSSAVHPGSRRRGVGGALFDARLHHLRRAGCTAALSLSWLSGDPDNSQGLLRSRGFVRIGEIPDYWRVESPGTGALCPVCGPVCRCTAAVYVVIW